MGTYKRTIITEDGSKMVMNDPNLSSNVTVYTIIDANENRGFYWLDENDKVLADYLLLQLKLEYLSYMQNLGNASRETIYKEIIKHIDELSQEGNICKYLKKKIEGLFQTTNFSFDDIKKELDILPTDRVLNLTEEYKETYTNKESVCNPTHDLLLTYLEERKESDSLAEIQEIDEFDDELNFTEKHPIISGFGKFLKNAAIAVLGDTIGMSYQEIENLQNADALSVVETFLGYSEAYKEDIAEFKKKKAFQERGMDYDLYQSMNNFEKSKYLNVHTKSKEERELFESGIKELDEEYSTDELNANIFDDEEVPSYLEVDSSNK